MSEIEVIAIKIIIITVVITVVCLIVLPRWYYRKKNPVDTTDVITAIYTAAAAQICLITGILGGLIVALMGLIISLQK
ncbi:hypothetical protein ES705_08080 [subsurface metagenome]